LLQARATATMQLKAKKTAEPENIILGTSFITFFFVAQLTVHFVSSFHFTNTELILTANCPRNGALFYTAATGKKKHEKIATR
jgi:hypothetical protein